jgi:peroxiredoxin
MSARNAITVALVAVAAWVLVRQGACGGPAIREGEAAPAFSVADVAGEDAWTLDEFKGKPVALVFFATWCGACRNELPAVARVVAQRPDVGVLAISDEPPAKVRQFLDRSGLKLPAAGDGRAAFRAYGIRSMPTVVVVGPDGTVSYAGEGGGAIAKALKSLIGA